MRKHKAATAAVPKFQTKKRFLFYDKLSTMAHSVQNSIEILFSSTASTFDAVC